MALRLKHIILSLLMLYGGLLSVVETYAQGKVVINEVMPYRNSASCGLGNEFVELINLGPGPQNVSCYVVATDMYTITLPNITLQPGQIFVMSGVKNIPINCANDIAITADLNWNDCNGCASANLTTGSGFLTDASNDKFPLLLLDPNLNILDALHFNTVVPYQSNPITVQAGQAGCATKTFNLSTYSNVKYETVTANTGNGNSYARNVDGGCSWIKETAENGGESNTSIGESYALSATQNQTITCNVANQTFNASSLITITPSTAFPITYTYGYSIDNVFTSTDTYTTSIDSDASTIPLSNLQVGYYSVLLQPAVAEGCNEFRLNFEVVNPILPVTQTSSLQCSGGTATFEITNPSASYFSMTYTRTYSVDSDLSTTDGLPVTGTVTSSSTNPDISFSNLTKGFYRIELDPAYGCNKILDFEVKDPILNVQKNFGLECTGGTATFEVTNASTETYFPIAYTRIYSATSSNVVDMNQTLGPLTINSSTSTPDISFANLPAGYYRLILDPANGCNDTTFFTVEEPLPVITSTYTLECSGGTAAFELTSTPQENYFPLSYTRTFSIDNDFSTIDGTVTNTIITGTSSPDISFDKLKPGYYRMEFMPANGCQKTINFQVLDTLLRPITPFTTTLYCADGGGTSEASLGTVRITFTNPSASFSNYLPIDYVYYNTASPTIAYTGTSTSTTDVYITGLVAGTYSITLEPTVGCDSDEYPFEIKVCPTLKETLKSFTGKNIGAENEFTIEIDTDELIQEIHLESSADGTMFKHIGEIPFENKKGMQTLIYRSPVNQQSFYRLQLHDVLNRLYNSSVIRITNQRGDLGIKAYPNPAGDHITLNKFSSREDGIKVLIMTTSGKIIYEEQFAIRSGNNSLKIPTHNLPKGQYVLSIYDISTGDRQSSTIIK